MTLHLRSANKIYTPYFNAWNQDVYHRQLAFAENPIRMLAGSTSGACVVQTDSHFVGLLKPVEAMYSWDGLQLTVDLPPESGFVIETGGKDAWAAYHQALALEPVPKAPFGTRPEYCTWVEQVWLAVRQGQKPYEVLTERFVREYIQSVTREDWPRGRLTIDEGWCPRHGAGGFGDWVPHAGLEMAALAREIRSAGHVPGLWFAASLISRTSRLAALQPDLMGEPFAMKAESGWDGFCFVRPGEKALEYYRALFMRAWEWGYRKFKLDLFYGPKNLMLELQRLCWEAIQSLPGEVELEGHIPDPLVSRYVHVVRLNDVLISEEHPAWSQVALAHWDVCCESAPNHLLNLDHLGGNCANVTEPLWCAHAGIMRGQLARGYPVISLLPRHVGARAEEVTTELLQEYSRLSRASTDTPKQLIKS